MLQQTGVTTVIPYFERWMARFPDVNALAKAREEEVFSHWAGLGYYSRARNLHRCAQIIAHTGWPKTSQEWQALPGIGRYTASAIATFAYNEAVPTVDGNIERVFARLTANRSMGSALKSQAWTWAEGALDQRFPALWNEALIELGATVCVPKQPRCERCPCQRICRAHLEGSEMAYPVKKAKPGWVRLNQVAAIYESAELTYAVRSPQPGEWWAGLHIFPRLTPETDIDAAEFKRLFVVQHVVTKHKISTQFVFDHVVSRSSEYRWVTQEEMTSLPMPAADRKAWKRFIEMRNEGHVGSLFTDPLPNNF